MKHYVYALVKDKKPIYVGSSSNLKERMKNHSYKKVFDYSLVISEHETKDQALLAERSIIKFLSMFPRGEIQNALYQNKATHAEHRSLYKP